MQACIGWEPTGWAAALLKRTFLKSQKPKDAATVTRIHRTASVQTPFKITQRPEFNIPLCIRGKQTEIGPDCNINHLWSMMSHLFFLPSSEKLLFFFIPYQVKSAINICAKNWLTVPLTWTPNTACRAHHCCKTDIIIWSAHDPLPITLKTSLPECSKRLFCHAFSIFAPTADATACAQNTSGVWDSLSFVL